LVLNTTGVTLGTTDEPSSPNPPSLVVDLIEGIAPVPAPPPGSITAWRADMYQGKKLFNNINNDKRVERRPSTPEWSIRSFPCIDHTPDQAWTWYRLPGSRQWLAFNCYTVYLHKPMGRWWRLQEDSLDSSLPPPVRPSIPHQSDFILAKLSLRRMTQIKGGDVTSCISGRSLSPTHPTPPSAVGSVLSKMGGNCLPSLLIPTATLAPTLATVNIPTKTAHQQQRPCRHTGCRHHP
jgi:hypothetical protein